MVEKTKLGEVTLAYVDEAGFAQAHPNRSAWTETGEVHLITAERGKRLNVLAALISTGALFTAKFWETPWRSPKLTRLCSPELTHCPGVAAWHVKEWKMSRRRRKFLDWREGERRGPGLSRNGSRWRSVFLVCYAER